MRRCERGSVADEARLVLFGSRMLASSRSNALALLPQMPWVGRAAQPEDLVVMPLLLWPEVWLEPKLLGPHWAVWAMRMVHGSPTRNSGRLRPPFLLARDGVG